MKHSKKDVGKVQNQLLAFVSIPRSGELSRVEPIISIGRYRKLLQDSSSTDDQVLKRLQFLEAFCRTIARAELHTYAQKPPTKK